jgi:hypothetical protein
MSVKRNKRKNNRARGQDRRFTVRGVRRDPVDMGKFSRALLGLAQAEAERQAQAEHAAHRTPSDSSEDTSVESAPKGDADAR